MLKIILPLIILATGLRILFVWQGAVSFHYDMARDAYEAQEIWKDHNLKILGPPTSTPGLYHGVLYYYLLAIPYGLSNGDPKVAALFLSFINSLTIIPIMLLAKDLFKSTKLIILAGFLYIISFEAVQYGPWISNPGPAILTVALFFLFLRAWQKGKSYGLYLAVVSAALSTQFQFFLIYLFFLIPIFGYIFKIKTHIKEIGISCFVAFLGLSNFLIAAIKFKTFGNIFLGFFNISTAGFIDFRPQFTELFLNYISRFTELFTYNFFPTNVILGGILSLLVLYAIRKEVLLLFYLFSNLPIIIFGGHSNTYANIGLAIPAILGTIILLKNITRRNKVLSLLLITLFAVSNLYAIFKYSPLGQIILVIPNDMVLKNELKLIDQTYKLAEGKPFSISSLTLPLWTNTTWAYLYSWYGKSKYGYVPSFYGKDQIGLLGREDLQKIEKPMDLSFFIIEPHTGIPERFYNEDISTEDSKTKLVKEFNFGAIKLQARKPVDEN